MTTPELSDRQRRVLRAIVEDYVATADPVGSRTVSRRYVPQASPATIRNDMADLEEIGYLEQPHTSAGRVPSDAGYRYYVDHILEASPVPETQASLIERVLGAKMRQVESLVQATVRVLSETSSLISFVLGPQLIPAALARVEITEAGPDRALLVLVSDAGFVETKLLKLPASFSSTSLKRLAELLNSLLAGQTWEWLSHPGALRDLRTELRGYDAVLDDAIEFFRCSLEPGTVERVYVNGVARLLSWPEFQDLNRMRTILGLLDQESVMSKVLLERLGAEGVTVTIGRENKLAEMVDCSLVSAPYHAGCSVGAVAVLGPKRMDYGLVRSLVDLVAANLDDILGRSA